MNRGVILFILISGLSFSCKPKTEIVLVEMPVLRASAIYNQDSVVSYIESYSDKHKETADVYFEKGLKIKDQNPEKAIYFIKRSITLHPRLSAYKELGSLLEKVGNFNEANNLYSFLIYYYHPKDNSSARPVFQIPDLDTYYNYIVTTLLGNGYFPSWILYDAKELGLDISEIKERLLKDERFKYEPSDMIYKNIMLQFMSEEEVEAFKNSEANFANFIASISDTSRIFEIDEKQVNKFKYNNENRDGEEGLRVTDLFDIYLAEKQDNQNKWYNYDYRHRIHLNDSVTAIVYAIDTSETACPIEMRHIYHQLVTYNKKGWILDAKVVAHQSGEEMTTMKFNTDRFTVNQYKRIWKKPYVKADFDNDLLNTEFVKEELYAITGAGKIKVISKEELVN